MVFLVPEGCKHGTFSFALEGSVTKKFMRLEASLRSNGFDPLPILIQKVAKPIGNNKLSLTLNLLGIYQIHHKTLSVRHLSEKKAIIQFVLLALIRMLFGTLIKVNLAN
jgi:hypothetical protein